MLGAPATGEYFLSLSLSISSRIPGCYVTNDIFIFFSPAAHIVTRLTRLTRLLMNVLFVSSELATGSYRLQRSPSVMPTQRNPKLSRPRRSKMRPRKEVLGGKITSCRIQNQFWWMQISWYVFLSICLDGRS